MNLPNKLTVFRIILVPILLILLMLPLPAAAVQISAAAVFILASLTDLIDGKIARKYSLITDFGKFMDPLADKFIVFAALLGILVRYDGTVPGFPDIRPAFLWAAAIVVFRELAVTSLRLVIAGRDGIVVAASWLGKVKTVTQIICVITILLEPVIFPADTAIASMHIISYVTMAVMTVMTIWSGLNYFKAYWKFLDPTK